MVVIVLLAMDMDIQKATYFMSNQEGTGLKDEYISDV